MNQPSALRLALSSLSVKMGLYFLVFGLIFIGVAAHFGADELHFLLFAQAAPATIIDKPIHRAGEGGSSDTRYLQKYRYVTATGKTIEDATEVSVSKWEQTQIGSPLRVWYDPTHPERNRFGPHGDWTAVGVFGLVGTVFGTIGAIFVLGRLRWIRLARRLVSEGVLVQGTVTRVVDTRSRERAGMGDWVKLYRVEYTFTDSGGQRREGRSNSMAEPSARRWHQGNTGPVRYDPADPSRNIWVSEWTAFQNPKKGNV